MEPTIYAAVIGALGGLVGALVVVFANQRALHAAEMRARAEMEQRLRIAQTDFEARLAIARSDQNNKFKLAALDKRMEAHQQAFTLWIKFFHSFHSRQAAEVAKECEEWWFKNCLYLEEKPRTSFKKGLFHAGTYQHYPNDMKEQIWPTIEAVIKDITEAVDLAFLPDGMEIKRIEDGQPCAAGDSSTQRDAGSRTT